jgi:hypothetical protein
MEQDNQPDTAQPEAVHPSDDVQTDPVCDELTGEPRVDAAIHQLGELANLPVAEHPQVFEHIHGQLVEVLGELHHGADAPDPGVGDDFA